MRVLRVALSAPDPLERISDGFSIRVDVLKILILLFSQFFFCMGEGAALVLLKRFVARRVSNFFSYNIYNATELVF